MDTTCTNLSPSTLPLPGVDILRFLHLGLGPKPQLCNQCGFVATQQNSSKLTYNDATTVCADDTKDDFIIFRLLAVKRIGGDRSKDTEGHKNATKYMHFALIST